LLLGESRLLRRHHQDALSRLAPWLHLAGKEVIHPWHSCDFHMTIVPPGGDLPGALAPDAGDHIGEHRLVLRRAATGAEERVLVLAAPLEDAVLKHQRGDVGFTR